MNLNWERGKKMTVTGRIIGTGSYVPERIVTNEDLAKLVETSDEWIVTRTGIHERLWRREPAPWRPGQQSGLWRMQE